MGQCAVFWEGHQIVVEYSTAKVWAAYYLEGKLHFDGRMIGQGRGLGSAEMVGSIQNADGSTSVVSAKLKLRFPMIRGVKCEVYVDDRYIGGDKEGALPPPSYAPPPQQGPQTQVTPVPTPMVDAPGFCGKCGSPLRPNVLYCTKCGAKRT